MRADDLIAQLRSLHELQVSCGQTLTTRGLVLAHGLGWYCRRNFWRGVRRGRLRECFRNAARLALSEDRYVYCEGFAIHRKCGFVIGEHAWVLDLVNGYEVVDPTWRDTKDGVYLGIPFKHSFLCGELAANGVYGLLGSDFGVPGVFRHEIGVWLHPDAGRIARDFTVASEEG